MIDPEICYSEESFSGGESIVRPNLGFEEDKNGIIAFEARRNRNADSNEESESTGNLRTHSDDDTDPFTTKELSRNQYLIFSGSIWGFVTKLRTWGKISSSKLSQSFIG